MKSLFPFFVSSIVVMFAGAALADSFADNVISYDPGATGATHWPDNTPYTDAGAALGGPDGITEGFSGDNILTPFNPAAALDEIVSIGEGGHLTLQLANYVDVGAGADIGVFGNVAVAEADWMNPIGTAGDPVVTFGQDPVTIEISYDRSQWVSFGEVLIDMPTNYYVDASGPYVSSGAGLTAANFGKPCTASVSDLAGKTWGEILTLLDGSAGGNWGDLSATGLTQVGYVRFTVPDDGDAETSLNFELDAVSIADGHVGQPVPEPAVSVLISMGAAVMLRRRRR